jgi:LmbE family N-acetylglucosaminyl deacetylase
MPRIAGRTILAVFAHPDDESLACGGTLARLADLGSSIVLICGSHGERGGPAGPAHKPGLDRTRARELRAAAEAIGISALIVLDHPDGDLRWAHVSEFQAQIVMALRRHDPAAVITFGDDGLYWHPDHIGVHERTMSAVRALGSAAPPIYYVTMPRGIMRAIRGIAETRGWTPPPKGFWSLEPDAFGLAASPPAFAVEVAAWVPRKLAALRCHESQAGSAAPLAYLTDDEAREFLCVEHFHRAAGSSAARRAILERIGDPVGSI